MRHFSAQQLVDHLKTSSPILIDVREPWEYAICHIDGSELIPMRTIPQQAPQMNPAAEMVIICHHGIRSKAVCEFLEHAGFTDVINLEGGVNAWAKQVDTSMALY